MRRPLALPDNRAEHLVDYFLAMQQYNRKRQRRQAAAIVVQNIWNNNPNGIPNGDHHGVPAAASPLSNYAQIPMNHSLSGDSGGVSGSGSSGRKSTAQPRPALTIPPKGIGPVMEPNENDVLCGRGGRINSHSGNIRFRDMVQSRKKDYLAKTTKKLEKAHIAASIVQEIRSMNPPGRFLKEERGTDVWYDIGDAKAIKKAGQALREDAPDIRQELDGDAGSSGDEKKKAKPKKKTTEGSPAVKKAPAKRVIPPPANAKSSSDDMSIASNATKSRRPVPSHEKSSDPSMVFVPLPISREQMFAAQTQSERTGPWVEGANDHRVASYDAQDQMDMPPPHAHHRYAGQSQSSLGPNAHDTSFNNRGANFTDRHKAGKSSSASVSRQAMEALAEPDYYPSNPVPPENIAFGRAFYPPPSGTEISGGGNTISTVSGLSDNVSGLSMDIGHYPAMPRASKIGGRDVRVSSRGSATGGRPHANHHHTHQRFPSIGRSSDVSGSFRSFGRSLSFSDMSNIYDPVTWKAVVDEEAEQGNPDNNRHANGGGNRGGPSNHHPFFQHQQQQHQSYPAAPSSTLSSGVMSTGSSSRYSIGSRFSFGQVLNQNHNQNHNPPPEQRANRGRIPSFASGMSMASISVGSTSSSQWTHGMANSVMDDGRSIFSDMSAELQALDLADGRS